MIFSTRRMLHWLSPPVRRTLLRPQPVPFVSPTDDILLFKSILLIYCRASKTGGNYV